MLQLLIVDDSKWVREGLTCVIDWAALNIEIAGTCPNAAKACEVLLSRHIDILLTDIKMIGMDGLELAEYARNHHPHIKTVLISAYKEFDYAFTAVRLGVSGYILKPIVPEDLIKVIRPIAEELTQSLQTVSPAPAASPKNRQTSSSNKNVASAIEYINQHISEKELSLYQIADALHVNYYYLSKCFKESEGVSFTDYVCKRRMQIASNLLIATKLHIYEICAQIGMDPKNFHVIFKKYYDMTPQEYRNANRLQE